MMRDACNAQKFVQNISPTIAWKSSYPRLNGNRSRIKLGGSVIASFLALRAITESPQKDRYVYQWLAYRVIMVFCDGAVNSRCYCPHLCAKLMIVQEDVARSRRAVAYLPVALFNYNSCPNTNSTAPRRFMKSSGMCFPPAHRGRTWITRGRPCLIWYTEVIHLYFLVLTSLKIYEPCKTRGVDG